MMTIDEAINHCNEIACKHNECAIEHKQLAEWLNELKELKKIEKKFIWSEEDEMMLQQITQYLISLSEECEADLNDKLNWLKSLKERMKGETK